MDLDVRCSAVWSDASTELDDGRCQLFMGHERPHAIAVATAGVRQLWLWQGTTLEKHPCGPIAQQLAWSPGMPRTTSAVTRLVSAGKAAPSGAGGFPVRALSAQVASDGAG